MTILNHPATGKDIVALLDVISALFDKMLSIHEELVEQGKSKPFEAYQIAMNKLCPPKLVGRIRVPGPLGLQKIDVVAIPFDLHDPAQSNMGKAAMLVRLVDKKKGVVRSNLEYTGVINLFLMDVAYNAQSEDQGFEQVAIEALDHEASHIRTGLFDPKQRKAAFARVMGRSKGIGSDPDEFCAILADKMRDYAKEKGREFVNVPKRYDTIEKKAAYVTGILMRNEGVDALRKSFGLTRPQAEASMLAFFTREIVAEKVFGVQTDEAEYLRKKDEMRSYTLDIIHETGAALFNKRLCGDFHELYRRGGDTGKCIYDAMEKHSRTHQRLKGHLTKKEMDAVERQAIKILAAGIVNRPDPLSKEREKNIHVAT